MLTIISDNRVTLDPQALAMAEVSSDSAQRCSTPSSLGSTGKKVKKEGQNTKWTTDENRIINSVFGDFIKGKRKKAPGNFSLITIPIVDRVMLHKASQILYT